nr:hypothetical protein [Tanacetum cinerariifolium]
MTNQTIPNDAEPNAPLIIVILPNIIKLISTNFLSCNLQIEATLVGYGSHISPPPTNTQNQTTTAYVTWHRQDRPLYGTLVEPTIVPLVSLTTTSKALWDILATTTTVTPTIAHPQHNRSRPVRYANGDSDDSDHPNKKMKMKIKVTLRRRVDLGLLLLHLHHLVGAVGVVEGAVRVANRPTMITLRVGAAKNRKKDFYDIKQELYSIINKEIKTQKIHYGGDCGGGGGKSVP